MTDRPVTKLETRLVSIPLPPHRVILQRSGTKEVQ